MADKKKRAPLNRKKKGDDLQVLRNWWRDVGSLIPDEVVDDVTTPNSLAGGNVSEAQEIPPGGPFTVVPQPGYVPGQQFFQFGPMMPMENTVESGSMPGMHYVPQGNGGVSMTTNSVMHMNSTVMSGGFVADNSMVQAAPNPTMMPQWSDPAQNGPMIYPGWSGMPSQPFDMGCGVCYMNQGPQNMGIPVDQVRPTESFDAYPYVPGAEVSNPGMLVPLYPCVIVPNIPWQGNAIPGAPIGMNIAQEGGMAQQSQLRTWSWAEQVQTTVVPPQTATLYQPMNQVSPRPVEAALSTPVTPNEQPGPTQIGPDIPVLIDLEKLMTSKEALVMLYHAYKCLEGEADNPNNRNCTFSRCQLTKELIKDMMSCPWGDNCLDVRCTNASRIINHWKTNCQLQDCSLCVAVRDM